MVGRIGLHVILIVLAILTLIPIVWMFLTAIKTNQEIFQWPLTIFPKVIQWKNFSDAWHSEPFDRYLLNTIFVSVGTVIFTLLTSSMAGFAFAKYEFFGKKVLFSLVLALLMIPAQVTLVPTYLIIRKLGFVNSYIGLLIPGLTSVFGIFMVKQYLQNIPDDLMDAARIDGCNDWMIFFRVIAPLITPALSVLAIFTFTNSWNSFLWPLIIGDTQKMYTLQVGITFFRGEGETLYHLIMAVSFISLLPVILVYVFFQRAFVSGIAMSGMK
jgi:ABC-type glycerol-3-phosphate transport system permease component